MFEAFVVDPEKRSRKTRRAAVSALRTAFEQAEINAQDHLFERVKAEAPDVFRNLNVLAVTMDEAHLVAEDAARALRLSGGRDGTHSI